MIKERILIIDLYLLYLSNQIAVVDRKEDDPILANTLTMIIVTFPLGSHPIAYIRQYLVKKGLNIESIDLLPAMYLNNFDSFISHPKLMAEFQKCNIKDLLQGHGMYYQGYYRDSDSSNEILKWEQV